MLSEVHSFPVAAAKKIGLEEAILLGHFEYWCSENALQGKHFHDGRYWTYASANYLAKRYPYITVSTIKRKVKKLESEGYIVTGNYNRDEYDRTKWYSVTEKGMEVLKLRMDDLAEETEARRKQEPVEQLALPIQEPAPPAPEPAPQTPEQDIAEEVEEIVDHLNESTGKRFRTNNQKTRSLISARLRDGFTVDDFKAVIDRKVTDWGRDPGMSKYLRPETLFGTKFEGYLNEKTVKADDGWDQDW